MAEQKLGDKGTIKSVQNWWLLPKNRKLRLFLLVVGVASICGGLYTIPSVSREITLATTRQPEPFTELYFTSPEHLGKTFTPNEPQIVRFTVRNHEGHTQIYSYVIYLDGVQAASGTTSIADNDAQSLTEEILVKSTNARSKITVTLLNNHQSIQYWTEKAQ